MVSEAWIDDNGAIKQFGFAQPIVVDKNNVVIIGHCRLLASKRLKLKEVPVVRMEDLTDEQVDKLRLLDNKLNESEWDMDLFAEDIPQLDFSDFEIDWGLKSKDDTDDDNDVEIEFSEILGEENNYIVLQFKNDIDWLQAQSLFNIKNVKCYSTRKSVQSKKLYS